MSRGITACTELTTINSNKNEEHLPDERMERGKIQVDLFVLMFTTLFQSTYKYIMCASMYIHYSCCFYQNSFTALQKCLHIGNLCELLAACNCQYLWSDTLISSFLTISIIVESVLSRTTKTNHIRAIWYINIAKVFKPHILRPLYKFMNGVYLWISLLPWPDWGILLQQSFQSVTASLLFHHKPSNGHHVVLSIPKVCAQIQNPLNKKFEKIKYHY